MAYSFVLYETCGSVCRSVYLQLESKIIPLFLCLLCSTAAAISCLFPTAPQDLKLSKMWQPRYNSIRRASLCGSRLCVCWHTKYVGVMCVLRYTFDMWHELRLLLLR